MGSWFSIRFTTTKSDSEEMGATGVTAHHKRVENENKIDWESAELQEFISREESGESSGDALRPPTTPTKKSESESTYQTAGSSSYLQAPSLSVIAPTPRSSPGGSRHNSGGLPGATYGLQVPSDSPQTANSKGKRKAQIFDFYIRATIEFVIGIFVEVVTR